MQIRPLTPADLPQLDEIDATVESTQYLHLERTGQPIATQWRLEERPLREKLIQSTRLTDDLRFLAKQLATGADEGIANVAEHDAAIVGVLLAQPDPTHNTLVLKDLRIDYDFRRQGVGTAFIFQLIQNARDAKLRAVMAESKTNNLPIARLLTKSGFELAGVDTHRDSNHDLVKESATLLWYAALD